MLGLVLVYFVGKYFYDLAQKHNKKPWPYAILGVVIYYGGQFGFGVLLGIVSIMLESESIFELPDIALGLIALPFGILCSWLLYTYLKRSWTAAAPDIRRGVDEFGRDTHDENFEKR